MGPNPIRERDVRSVSILGALLAILLCASAGSAVYFGYQYRALVKEVSSSAAKHAALEKRVKEFNGHLIEKRFGDIWEMFVAELRRDIPKEEYARMAGAFLKFATLASGDKAADLDGLPLFMHERTGMHRVNFRLRVADNKMRAGYDICQEVFWIWRDGDWHARMIFSCGEQEIK